MSANLFWIFIGVVGFVVFVFLFIGVLGSLYQKAGPNEVLIVSGRRHSFVDATGERSRAASRSSPAAGRSLCPSSKKSIGCRWRTSRSTSSRPSFTRRLGVPIMVDGVAQIKVKSDDVSIATAAEQFLTKTLDEIKSIAYQTVSGHLRAILGTMTVEEVMTGHEAFAAARARSLCGRPGEHGPDGRQLYDSQHQRQSRLPGRAGQATDRASAQDATIGEAEANRDATIKSADANRQGQIAKLAADTVVAEADRDYKMKLADYQRFRSAKKGRVRPGVRLAEIQDAAGGNGGRGAGRSHPQAARD